MSRLVAAASLVGVVIAYAPGAGAEFTPPVIAVQSQARRVETSMTADVGFPFSDMRSTNGGGTFEETVTGQVAGIGSSAEGGASQRSAITTFVIEGVGTASSSATGDEEFSASAGAVSEIGLDFVVPVDAPFALTGTVDTTGGGSSAVVAQILFLGTDPAGQVIFETVSSELLIGGGGEKTLFVTGTMKGGAAQRLFVEARVVIAGTVSSGGNGTATFTFRFDMGDTDGDGLLDVWEEDGIDIDGDGIPEIDLPAMGADPMHKDLFVEIDAMTGLGPAPGVLGDVQNAFALAPAALVRNPDGQPGVNLHFVDEAGDQIDEDTVPPQIFGPDPWPEFDLVKQSFFGRASDRMKPNWSDIEAAWKHVFRYCLWAKAAYDPSTDPTGKTSPTGTAERPGDDCIIFKDTLTQIGIDADGEAGTFMHELGHTLGLRHGGTDDIPYKPQYFSVMNYTFQIPFRGLEDSWFLDYSRMRLPSLDESALLEVDGVGGAPVGFGRVIWNCAAEGAPRRHCNTPLHAFQPVDWDQNGAFDPNPVARNLNDVYPVGNPDLTADDQVLDGANDWSQIWYHLTGDGNFEDGVRDLGGIPVELTAEDIEGMAAIEKSETIGTPGTTTTTTVVTSTTAVVPTTTTVVTTSTASTTSLTSTTMLATTTSTTVSTTTTSSAPPVSTTSTSTTTMPPATRLFPPGTKLLVKAQRSGRQRLDLLARGSAIAAADPCAVDGELLIASLGSGAPPRRFTLAAAGWKPLKAKKPAKGCSYQDDSGVGVRITPGKKLKLVARAGDLGVPLASDPRPIQLELRHGDVHHCFAFGHETKGRYAPGRKLLAKKAEPATVCPLDGAAARARERISPAGAPSGRRPARR